MDSKIVHIRISYMGSDVNSCTDSYIYRATIDDW